MRHIVGFLFLAGLALPVLAQEQPATTPAGAVAVPSAETICFRQERIECPAGATGCPTTEELRAQTSACNDLALEGVVKKQGKELVRQRDALAEIEGRLEDLKSSKKKDFDEFKAQLLALQVAGFLTSEEVDQRIDEAMMASEDAFDQKVTDLKDGVGNALLFLEQRISELEDKVFIRRTQVVFGGAFLVALQGVMGGAAATLLLPLGDDGAWTLGSTGWAGGARYGEQSGIGYGFQFSLTNWVGESMEIGPAVLGGFNSGTEADGFTSVLVGAGVEVKFHLGTVEISLTPFAGAGADQDHEWEFTAGGQIAAGLNFF